MSRPGFEERLRIEQRRNKIADLLSQDVNNSCEIARRLGIDATDEAFWNARTREIRRDIQAIEEEWLGRRQNGIALNRARQISRLKKLRAEAMAAWERSKVERQSSRTRRRTRPTTGADGKAASSVDDEAEVKKEQRDGDPRFLAVAMDCEKELAKLQGTHRARRVRVGGDRNAPPIRHEHTGTISIEAFERLPVEERIRLLRSQVCLPSGN